jgi:murein L,D-transpeptidase YafK
MWIVWIRRILIWATTMALLGCASGFDRLGIYVPPAPPAPATSPPSYQLIDPDSTDLPWARDEEFFIMISRPCRRLDVFRWGHLIRRYPAVFGQNPAGSKRYQGDRRTPSGFYEIIDKRRHRRWARFLLIDYPNGSDQQRYAKDAAAGTLPTNGDDSLPGIGGAIGIHGSDKEELNKQGIDWTFGCISLRNDDVIELDRLVPVGTPVFIAE